MGLRRLFSGTGQRESRELLSHMKRRLQWYRPWQLHVAFVLRRFFARWWSFRKSMLKSVSIYFKIEILKKNWHTKYIVIKLLEEMNINLREIFLILSEIKTVANLDRLCPKFNFISDFYLKKQIFSGTTVQIYSEFKYKQKED